MIFNQTMSCPMQPHHRALGGIVDNPEVTVLVGLHSQREPDSSQREISVEQHYSHRGFLT